jgi:hypothetical protein
MFSVGDEESHPVKARREDRDPQLDRSLQFFETISCECTKAIGKLGVLGLVTNEAPPALLQLPQVEMGLVGCVEHLLDVGLDLSGRARDPSAEGAGRSLGRHRGSW